MFPARVIEQEVFSPGGRAPMRFRGAVYDRVNQQIEPFEAGTPSAYHPQIVIRVNSLQMLYAGRWIVSSKADFSLPLKMIADDPAFRERRKLEVE